MKRAQFKELAQMQTEISVIEDLSRRKFVQTLLLSPYAVLKRRQEPNESRQESNDQKNT